MAEHSVSGAEGLALSILQGMFDSRAIGVSVFDMALDRTVAVNDYALELTGYTREEFEAGAWRWRDMTPREWAHLDERAAREAAKRGWCDPYEKEWITKSGDRVPVRASAARLPSDPTKAIVFIEDLRRERRVVAERDESDRRFRLLADLAPGFVWFAEPDGAIRYLNEGWYAYTGQTPEEALNDGWADVLHPDDRERTLLAWSRARDGGTPYETELRYRNREGEHRWFVARAAPYLGNCGRVEGWFGSSTDIHALKSVEAALRDSQARLDLAQDAGGVGLWDWNLQTGELHWSPTLRRIAGIAPDAPTDGEAWRALVHPDDREEVEAEMTQRLEPRPGVESEEMVQTFRILRPDDGQVAWFESRGRVLRDSEGRAVRVIGVNHEVTAAKRMEERQRLLINELNHRVKNTLATVQAIAAQTLRNSATEARARLDLEARLLALSRVHDVLTQESWSDTRVRDVVDAAARPLGAERFDLQGPEAAVGPETAVALAMALHELGTNACKYGALSDPAGRVRIGWSLEGDRLRLRWSEHDGPPVSPPERRGFGTRLLERGLAHDLEAKARLSFERDGVVCVLEAPIARARDNTAELSCGEAGTA